MIDALRPYAEMKRTGLPWLGDVPAHWDVLRSKYAFREVDSRSTTGEETHLSMSQRFGLVPANQVKKSLVSESYVGAKLVEKDDLVLNRLKAHLGVFAYVKLPGLISPDYTVLRPKPRANVRFFEYVLKSSACRAELRTRAKGIVEGFWRLYTDDFYDIRLPVPPLDEQRLIVRFLDWHGAQTAKLIRAKKTLIALLNEQKQAIIHRAVTRGLNPNVKLKPSGIPWLGDVPEGWAIMRLRHLIKGHLTYGANAAAEFNNPEWPRYIRITDFRSDGSLRSDTFRSLPPEIACNYIVEPGDILFARSGATVGKAFLVTDGTGHACHAGYLIRARPLSSLVHPEYLYGFTQSRAFFAWKELTFNTATIQNIGADKYANLVIPLPFLDEQQVILDSVRLDQAPLTTTIIRVEEEIALIQEFRTRLIADVVTGKLDVRAAAASLPDVTELEPIDEQTDNEDLDETMDVPENEEVAA